MEISPLGSSASTGSTGGLGITRTDFLQILLAELKAQDPLSPMDTQAMTTQLTLLNILEELIQIKDMLKKMSAAFGSTASQVQPRDGGGGGGY
ncbi:flagellar biosynthesis protein FlgD [Coprothermobacteraceae bacterium]|nr:flagellar biosynthesis protein FlgD [Coprothermobacteraceae bacterium]